MRFGTVEVLLAASLLLGGCGLFGTSQPDSQPADDMPGPSVPASDAPAVPVAPSPSPSRGRPGRWRVRSPPDPVSLAEALEAMGYAEGSLPPRSPAGAHLIRPEDVEPGLHLYTSGHAPGAWLTTVRGEVLHRWRASWAALHPGQAGAAHHPNGTSWRRVVLLDDGSVLAVFEGLGIARIAQDGTPIWVRDNGAHHDLEVVGDRVWVLTRRTAVRPRIDPVVPVLDDAVEVLDLATGATQRRVSLLDAWRAGGHGPIRLTDHPERPGDVFHTNTLDVITAEEAAGPARPGDVLLSLLATSTLALLDPEAGVIRWTLTGDFTQQHEPFLEADGTITLFDNHHRPEASRVVTVDPSTGAARWAWDAAPGGLWSATCGTVARLPGGHLLITESDGGRAFEIDGEGGLVAWWSSPHRAGRDDRWVATLYEVQRVPRPAWLDE